MSAFELQGRRVLVTGASGGLGLAICELLAAQGAHVLASDRPGPALQAVAAAGHLPADLGQAEDGQALAREAIKAGVTDLVLNAGIEGPRGPMAGVEMDRIERCLAINLLAPLRLCQALLPQLALQGGGAAVLMASIAGLRGNAEIGAYAMSKAALAQHARDLAVQWGPRGIRVNALAPGLIDTPLAKPLLANATFRERRLRATPLRRAGEPFEIAGTVAWLLAPAGGFVTGQTIVVDGGTLISDGS